MSYKSTRYKWKVIKKNESTENMWHKILLFASTRAIPKKYCLPWRKKIWQRAFAIAEEWRLRGSCILWYLKKLTYNMIMLYSSLCSLGRGRSGRYIEWRVFIVAPDFLSPTHDLCAAIYDANNDSHMENNLTKTNSDQTDQRRTCGRTQTLTKCNINTDVDKHIGGQRW